MYVMGLRRYLGVKLFESKLNDLDFKLTDIDSKLNELMNRISIPVMREDEIDEWRNEKLSILSSIILNEGNLCEFTLRDSANNKLHMRINDTDLLVYKQVFVDNEYDSDNLPDKANVIVDLGANIGLSALFFMKKYKNTRIIAVEPDGNNFNLAKKNLRNYLDDIELLNAAIWCEDGYVSLVDHDDNKNNLGSWGVRTENTNCGSDASIVAICMNTIIDRFSIDIIDILKVDIEGAEFELFSKNYDGWLNRVNLIIIETHDRFKAGSESAVRNALKDTFVELPRKGENLFFKRL